MHLRIIAIRRSGQHAIITWILNQFQNYRFFNDPFCYRDSIFESNDSADYGHDLGDPNLAKVIYNVEDWDLNLPIPHLQDPAPQDILILRDPYNTFASRISMTTTWPKRDRRVNWTGPSITSLWIQHAKEALSITNFLPEKCVIKYNQWLVDPHYRESILKELGIPLQNNSINFQTLGGAESHFKNEDRLHRYFQYENDPIYQEMIQNQELKEISSRLFPEIP